MDLSPQIAESKEAGIIEVLRLLQHPEDLSKLNEIHADYTKKLKASRALVGGVVQQQVESIRQGVDLVEMSHRSILKLRASLDRINALCEECSSLIDHQDRIKVLSIANSNMKKVLAEIEDIVVLPSRADMVLNLLDDPAYILPAFEALTVLEGTAENAKAAWERNIKERDREKYAVQNMTRYVERVSEVVLEFEERLLSHIDNFLDLSESNPTLIVDCMRVIELQEQLDKKNSKFKQSVMKAKHYKDRLFLRLQTWVDQRFKDLMLLAESTGDFNRELSYDQHGSMIVEEKRDHLGQLKYVRIQTPEGQQHDIFEQEELRGMDITTESVFDEDVFMKDLIEYCYSVELDLSTIYDTAAPCFPPSYYIFDALFQMYHVNVSQVVDLVGQRAESLSSAAQLKMMEFVRKYMETLRGLGVEDGLLRLPPVMHDDPDQRQGLDLLMDSYIGRMEETMSKWYINILKVDLEYPPKRDPQGLLRTPGATEFFRIMNEEIAIILSIDDHGVVMFNTAKCSLRVMRGFQEAMMATIGGQHLSFEMMAAFLNNNIRCYDQSLEFANDVQKSLLPELRSEIDIEETCRGFLDVAKVASKHLSDHIFNDAGMSSLLKSLFNTPEWSSGKITATIIATVKDYMGDVSSMIEQNFVKRVAESAAEEFLRRFVLIFVAGGVPAVTDEMLTRMEEDERSFHTYFSQYLKPDKLEKLMDQFCDIRKLVGSAEPPVCIESYKSLLLINEKFTIEVLQRILDSKPDTVMPKKARSETLSGCKELWKDHQAAKNEPVKQGGWGWW